MVGRCTGLCLYYNIWNYKFKMTKSRLLFTFFCILWRRLVFVVITNEAQEQPLKFPVEARIHGDGWSSIRSSDVTSWIINLGYFRGKKISIVLLWTGFKEPCVLESQQPHYLFLIMRDMKLSRNSISDYLMINNKPPPKKKNFAKESICSKSGLLTGLEEETGVMVFRY